MRAPAAIGFGLAILAAIAHPHAPARAAASLPIAARLVPLAAHRAVYDLTLSRSSDGQTVAASGRMTFELRDGCKAWATEQTLAIDETDRDGGQSSTRSDYATYETKDGRSLSFAMNSGARGQTPTAIRGTATRDATGGTSTVRFTAPRGVILHLPIGTLFPIAHTKAILDAAGAGRRELAPILFDGTGTDGAEYTYATILGWGDADGVPPDRALDHMKAGRVHIAFYPLLDHAMAPEYEMGMRYFANGVSDRLDMDFGGFRLAGDLRSLVMLPAARCAR